MVNAVFLVNAVATVLS